jgi:LysM repeat protein
VHRFPAVPAIKDRSSLILQDASRTDSRISKSPARSQQERILQLQQTVGNRATRQLLESERRSSRSLRSLAPTRTPLSGQRVQRYESGEHAKLGETQAELQAAFAPTKYIVQKGDTVDSIASRFGLTVDELKEANKDKLQKLPGKPGSRQTVEGFNPGESVSIPQKLNDLAKTAVKDKSAKFTVNGVVLDYGVGIAMGDLFESPEQMARASPQELQELATLILRERSGQNVTQAEWQKATKGRYLTCREEPDPLRP